MTQNAIPKIGLLRWEAATVPNAIRQIGQLKGSCGNPDSFEHPVLVRHVKGTNAETIVLHPSQEALDAMVAEMESLISEGITAIATSCGFNAIHQKKLANAVNVPVFSSSLMQIPFVWRMLKEEQAICVITARAKSLTKDHFNNVGVAEEIPVHVKGVEDYPEWSKLLSSDLDIEVDLDLLEKEIVSLSLKAIKDHPEIGAFVIECTDIPPFTNAIREATKLPVFDFVTMVNYVYQSL